MIPLWLSSRTIEGNEKMPNEGIVPQKEAEKVTLIAAHAAIIEAGVVNPAPVGKAKERERENPLAIPTTSFKKPNARNPKGKRRMARKIAKFAGTIN